MTKAQTKKALQAAIDRLHKDTKERTEGMKPVASNPQVALMIEKNKGYLLALEDVVALLYTHKVF